MLFIQRRRFNFRRGKENLRGGSVVLSVAIVVNWLFFFLRTFVPKSSYDKIFYISRLELVHKVLTPKMKKKMEVTDFVSKKMAVEKCLNFDKSVIIKRCSLLCYEIHRKS